jgi:hypothetical protein
MNDFPGSEDEQMRRLLNDALSDVEPTDTLDSIHARTGITRLRSRRRWLLGAGAAVVATAATVAVVSALGSGPGTTSSDPGFAGSPSASNDTSASASTDASASASASGAASSAAAKPGAPDATGGSPGAIPVYYVGSTNYGPRLFREFHQSDGSRTAERAAVDQAVTQQPDDPDYRVPWPEGTTVDEVTFDEDGGLITVNLVGPGGSSLRDRPAGMSADEAKTAIQQIVYTAQAATQSASTPVQIETNGNKADSVLGVPASEPFTRGSAMDVEALVWITDPAEGSQVPSTFTVDGLANAFEATVQWELMKGNHVVKKSFATAKEAMTMSPYSFTVKNVPPGHYTLVVHDEDASGGAEGHGPWQDTKNIKVVG